jgi:hypothetical protein
VNPLALPVRSCQAYLLAVRFVVDVSSSMGKMREIEVPTEPGKPSKRVQITNLEWALRFVMLKVQELVSKEAVTLISYN